MKTFEDIVSEWRYEMDAKVFTKKKINVDDLMKDFLKRIMTEMSFKDLMKCLINN